MSKRKQEIVKSDLLSNQLLAVPSTVARRDNLERTEETENRDATLMEEIEKAKASSRRTHLIALSKVVNRAFTGWTIKTQR